MKTATRKKTTAKKTTRSRRASPLSICPVNGAGWCPYPFSAKQLERRMKEKAQAEAEASLEMSVGKKVKSK